MSRARAWLLAGLVGAVAAALGCGAGSLNPDAFPAGESTPGDAPAARPFSDGLADALKVPAGFHVRPFARGLDTPRMLAVGPDGSVYVTSPTRAQVLRLFDADGDGDATDPGETTIAVDGETVAGLEGVEGIAIRKDSIFLASTKNVLAGRLEAGAVKDLRKIATGLPDAGMHATRTIGVGPDGYIYVGVGSDCNACAEVNTEHAGLLRITRAGAPGDNLPSPKHPVLARDPGARVSARVYASGLRDTLGFDWHPTTGTLWGVDDGSEGLGDDSPPVEVNLIVGGHSYGWPYCWADERVDPNVPDPTEEFPKSRYCEGTMVPLATLPAHSAPVGFVFYRGDQFPDAYKGDAFIALRGSQNRAAPSGYAVVRLHFIAGQPAAIPGQSSSVQEFLSGFLVDGGAAQFGRLAGLAIDAEGALLVAEDGNGVVYRVTYAPEQPGGSIASE